MDIAESFLDDFNSLLDDDFNSRDRPNKPKPKPKLKLKLKSPSLTNAERQRRYRERGRLWRDSIQERNSVAVAEARAQIATLWAANFGNAAFTAGTLVESARSVPSLTEALHILAPSTVRGGQPSLNRLGRELRSASNTLWAPELRLCIAAAPDIWRFAN
jgi:hypothetical protein